jgi:hypothetical protein
MDANVKKYIQNKVICIFYDRLKGGGCKKNGRFQRDLSTFYRIEMLGALRQVESVAMDIAQ